MVAVSFSSSCIVVFLQLIWGVLSITVISSVARSFTVHPEFTEYVITCVPIPAAFGLKVNVNPSALSRTPGPL